MIGEVTHAFTERHHRRAELQAHARACRGRWPVPVCRYTLEEHALWREVLAALEPAHARFASRRFHEALRRLALPRARLPQLVTLNRTLSRATGFVITPAVGFVDPSVFFRQLSRANFMATLYLRDPATPTFTPEPDFIHEVIGHGVMLADATYAAISHTLAIAAEALRRMGAPAARLQRIERVYWYTMETGLVREPGSRGRELRACGAAVLSSVRELQALAEHAPRRLVLDEVAERPYSYTDVQTDYFYCDNLDRLRGEITAWVSRELAAARVGRARPPSAARSGR